MILIAQDEFWARTIVAVPVVVLVLLAVVPLFWDRARDDDETEGRDADGES